VSDFNVLERIFGFLSTGTTGPADPLESEEDFTQEPRRTQFGHTYGPADGKPEQMAAPVGRYIPGELDDMAAQAGIASDDPYQLEAKLMAWKRYGYPERDEDDQRRLREFLHR